MPILFIIISIVLLTFGPQIGGLLAAYMGLGNMFEVAWNLRRWPVILCLLSLVLAVLSYFAPDVQQEWKWITPGAVFAVIGWIIATLGFSYYVNNISSYTATYGSIGAVIVLLTWMYLGGLLILIGGEVNAEIEHAARDGKAPGQKELPSQQKGA